MLLLTRATRGVPATSPAPAEPALSEVVVTASRYAWVRIQQPSLTRLSEAELHLAPNVGDDPLRTIARLPGAVGSDLSARLNVRGGAADETLVRFDGLRLVNPFHLKDFQSIFSAINPALVGAVDLYTGGFPVSFGDRMSGVIDIHPVRADAVARRELAVSLVRDDKAAGNFGHAADIWQRTIDLDRVSQGLRGAGSDWVNVTVVTKRTSMAVFIWILRWNSSVERRRPGDSGSQPTFARVTTSKLDVATHDAKTRCLTPRPPSTFAAAIPHPAFACRPGSPRLRNHPGRRQPYRRRTSPGTGTLYTAIARLVTLGLIEDTDVEDGRRRHYHLTRLGRRCSKPKPAGWKPCSTRSHGRHQRRGA